MNIANLLVYIVESPSPKEIYNKSYEGQILSDILRFLNITNQYKMTINKEEFLYALTENIAKVLLKIIEQRPEPPRLIIHISAHGDETGIQLSCGELITWDELREILSPLNKALSNTISLCMSSCKGFNGIKMAFSARSPFHTIIGSPLDVSWSDTIIGFSSLYHLLNKTTDIRKAIKGMRVSSGNKSFLLAEDRKIKEIFAKKVKDKIQEIKHEALKKALIEMLEKSNDHVDENRKM